MYFPFVSVYSLECYTCFQIGSADDEENVCLKSKLEAD